MTNQVWTKITFPAYALRIAAVAAAIDEECPDEPDARADDQDAPDGGLAAIAGNTHDGFNTLAPVLQKHRIPHDRWTEADFERAELIVYFRTGQTKKQDYYYSQFCANGQAIVYIEELKKLLQMAKKGAAAGKALKALLDDHTIPPLRDFIVPPKRLKKRLTAADPNTAKETMTVAAQPQQ